MESIKKHPIQFILLFYTSCFIFRFIEYFIIRTDQSILGEAFIHKLIGIVLLVVAVWLLKYQWREIGFDRRGVILYLGVGLALGVGVYIIAYAVEMTVLVMAGNSPSLEFFATSYTTEGNRVLDSGMFLVLVCLIGNVINVVMEEGVFRGLFIRVAAERHAFWLACVFSSLLFGFWHIVQPLRNVFDGTQSWPGAMMMGLMLIGTSALAGFIYVLLVKLTGSIWASMAVHFVNNTSANLIHVVAQGNTDAMMTMRITVASSLLSVIVIVAYLVFLKKRQRSQSITSLLT
ncbi:MAG: CPBP family intramembrane metalloprotease [Coriobacteriales bacterium]|jgi:membrane protease YdiL (CAAX protease family)|nr:CPBP family intramembrane metalloprotease [Coriobacteriales bacterium]